ncbi:MAG TPA: hypothetical protein VFR42_10725 [Candidatus Acidoferrum sp.]|nr:hypothetical protein [Candidatus Acidoferrum sp.]
MVSGTLLSVVGITVWAAVLVTAAPRVISHRYSEHSVEVSTARDEWPAANCNDLHIEFDGRDAVMQSEEKTITRAEASTLRVQAESNGGVQVQGWEQNNYSVTLCKAARPGGDAENLLSQIKLTFANGELGISGPNSRHQWSAHLLIKAPRGAAMDLNVNNGPMGLFEVEGNLKVHAVNGPITVEKCKGVLNLTAENGPISLEENSGKLNVRTQNGPITISLEGKNWNGEGLEAHATNGPVTLRVPSGYQSGVVLESDGHGPFSCAASVCNEGRKTWDENSKRVEFGSGPAVVRVSTVNGPVSVH